MPRIKHIKFQLNFQKKICFSRKIHAACLLLLLGAQPLRAEILLSLGSGAYWYQATATTGAVNQFLGRPPSSDGGSNGGTIDGRSSVDTNGPLRLKHHSAVALTWRHSIPLTHRLDLVGGVRLEYGRTRWFIKDGIDILRDDLTVRLNHISLTPTVSLRAALPDIGNWRSDITGGIGATRLVARTHITSALLEVRRSAQFTDRFAFTRLGLSHAAHPAERAVLDIEWRDSTGFNLKLGLEHRF